QIFPRSNDDIVENTGTGINEATAANLTINATKGGVIINAAEATAISIYTIAGQLVKTTTVEAGSTLINLPAGVYVIAGSKVVIL
ncbi:MAG: T9SS type A sorting domain-containing protein, partial [Bacteroidales bacterium]